MYMWIAAALATVALVSFEAGRRRAFALSGGNPRALHSRPRHHGALVGLVALLAGSAVLVLSATGFELWLVRDLSSIARASYGVELHAIQIEQAVHEGIALARGEAVATVDAARTAVAERYLALSGPRLWVEGLLPLLAAAVAGAAMALRVHPGLRARSHLETLLRICLLCCAGVAVLATVGIVMSLAGETLRFFSQVPPHKFLFGFEWAPLSGVFEGSLNIDRLGALPLFLGTAMITLIAILVAAPVGLLAAIYLAEFASSRTRGWAKPLLEILAGIPTVVYGFFAALTVAPALRGFGGHLGIPVASESALAAGLVMGIMIIPFVSSLSDDVINAVPQSLRDGSMALGATSAETVRRVVLPAALPGIVSAILLGVSRAVGETMIVVMAAGQGANLTANPLQAVTTVTVQIVALITGDTEAETAAGPAFALGFTLFCVTLALNVVALRIVRRYREVYE